ncbi:metallophosphoesterase family protein [Pseudomonas viridiflava]|uniref:metallophosphoesterase family protein n=1 Tax=Pseudomonas viridiflava TaxID=33069 RepID=UPI001F11F3A4|nr:metallophosphoesterase [Pseudomonas viridiflava]
MEGRNFSWLHLSDQHIGMSGSKIYWPQVRDAFFEDIRQHLLSGKTIDLVIFSGDLVQQGLQEEFDLALVELKGLFTLLENCDCHPGFFIVPGNHDLVRVDEASGLPFAITEAGKRNGKFKESVLKKNDNNKQIISTFKYYTKFINSLRQEGIPLIGDISGIFPGDTSSRLEMNGMKIGIVGLNTAWSQISGGDYKERIEVFADQFLAIVEGDPSVWLKQNDINILVTHHPQSWFSELSFTEFTTEIFLARYFDLHLYGHMHEIEAIAEDHGDGHVKRTIQGASLFGMERDPIEGIKRHHGYMFGSISENDEKLTLWPRKIEKTNAFGWKVSIDSQRVPGAGDIVTYPIKTRHAGDAQKKTPQQS